MFIYKYHLIDGNVCVSSINASKGLSSVFPVTSDTNEGIPFEAFNILNEDGSMYSFGNNDESKKTFLYALIERENDELSKLYNATAAKEKHIKSLYEKIPPTTIYQYKNIKGNKDILISPCEAIKTKTGYKVTMKTNFGTIVDNITDEEIDEIVITDNVATAWSWNENLSADFLFGLPNDW